MYTKEGKEDNNALVFIQLIRCFLIKIRRAENCPEQPLIKLDQVQKTHGRKNGEKENIVRGKYPEKTQITGRNFFVSTFLNMETLIHKWYYSKSRHCPLKDVSIKSTREKLLKMKVG